LINGIARRRNVKNSIHSTEPRIKVSYELKKELDLIRESGCKAFPPRLPEQPIFYPVLFLAKYEVHMVGGSIHQEYWIPAEDLDEFNTNIAGEIEIVAEYRGTPAVQ
jgi:hypothetical protein